MGKRIRLNEGLIVVAVMFACSAAICERCNGEPPRAGRYTNSIGMELVRIEPGQFRMGFEGPDLPAELTEPAGTDPQGDYDEHPAHIVEITRPFYMSIYEVTNYQYELFDPSHKKYRGASKQDNSAVVNVNWYEAQAFCQWLNDREGLTAVGTRKGTWGPMVYRLPTEAEWEYACRAGTTTPFSTGDGFGPGFSEGAVQDLVVGRSPANAWGLYDMHGNVEEWCYDWYGPYPAGKQTNPVGPADGDFRVTRGGSHSTAAYYLRSANRMGTLPEDKHSLIGFRIVLAAMPPTEPWAPASPQRYQLDVRQKKPKIFRHRPDPKKPYFYGARKFMVMPASNRGPLYARHNHFISVVECPNGDLLAIWHTCIGESGRELNVAASRLRYGTDLWEPASLFWDAPDRNDHGHAMWYDGRDTIYHFQGLATQVRDVALVVRTSTDNGVTWSKPRIIADHGPSRMPVESVFSTKQGWYAISCDKGPNVLWMSKDKGLTWFNPGGVIRGKHACAVQLDDGRLLAYGREANIDGRMPTSISEDMGKSYTYAASEFQPISWGQRAVLLRLKEGPLFFASFCKRLMVPDAGGGRHEISGLFGAVSFDQGKTWPHKRLITSGGPDKEIETMDGHLITMNAHRGEAAGYLTVCQGLDDVIHLLSSRQHYAFNLKWLTTLAPAAPERPPQPQAKPLPRKSVLQYTYNPADVEQREIKRIADGRGGGWKIDVGNGRGFYLRSGYEEPFIKVDPQKGFTAEIKTRLLKYAPGQRGVDIELYDGAAARYAISITDKAVYWYEGFVVGSALLDFGQFTPVAEGFDNTDAMHTYRLAVRPDRIVQIYRDGKLLGVRRYEYRTPRDAYIQFGGGRGLEALVERVSYDIDGPFAP